jgi:hypothetical protein
MINAILGYGRTLTESLSTGCPQIQLVLCPFDSEKRPVYSKAWLKPVNITDLAGLKMRGELDMDSTGLCNLISSEFEKTYLTSVKFNPAMCEVLPLAQLPEASNWFLGQSNEAFRELSHMNVLVVRTKNSSKPFLVPSVVIAQYYLPHSMLLEFAMKQIPLSSDLYDEASSILKPPSVRIKLRDKAPGKIAVHLARFLVDPYAAATLSEIQKRSLHTKDDTPASFYMKPPVNQITEWTMSCVDVNDAYWVRQIVSCTAEFPFSELTYEKDRVEFIGEGTKPKTLRRKKHVVDDAKLALGEGSDPESGENEINSVVVSRYPSLHSVALRSKVEKVPRERIHKIKLLWQQMNLSISTGPNGFAMVHGRTSISNCKDDDQVIEENLLHHRLTRFYHLLVFLQQQYETELVLLDGCEPHASANGENVIPYDSYYADSAWHRRYKIIARNKDDRVKQWREVGRRFYLAKCTTRDFVVYIIEFVPGFSSNDSASMLLLYSRSSIDQDEIVSEIRAYCKSRRTWPQNSLAKNIIGQKLPHNDNETETELASRILKFDKKTLTNAGVVVSQAVS